MLAAAAAAAAAAPGSDAAKPRCVKTVKVVTGDDPEGNLFFSKRRVTIREGSCVRWVWTGTLDHQVEGKGLHPAPAVDADAGQGAAPLGPLS